jgi:uncharacterized membrane protein
MLAVTFESVVLAIHVMAVVATFGIVFAYPLIAPWLRQAHPEAVPGLHEAQVRIIQMLVNPGMVVILLAGIYLASKFDVWNETWVSIPLLILLVLGGMFGALFMPTERKLAELARRDLAAGALSAEYDTQATRLRTLQLVAAALVLVAVFFMVAKP